MRFGLIGYGLWGRHHANAIAKAPGAELAAIACASEATAAMARRDFPHVPILIGYEHLLVRPDIDAVVISVPNHLHAEIGAAALAAGKDVLLEKPMATTLEDCDRLIAAARASGRVLSIGHELRLSAQYGRVKDLIDTGEIGTPRYLSFSLFRFPFRPGSGGWRYDAARVGSWILEEPIHFFDFTMWYFASLGDPLSVQAIGASRAGEAGMSSELTVILRFAAGAHAVITETLAGFEYHQLLHVVGADGSIRSWWSGALDRTREARYELRLTRSGCRDPETIPITASGELVELEEQARRIVSAFQQRKPLVSGEESKKRIAVCLAVERSLEDNGEIPLTF